MKKKQKKTLKEVVGLKARGFLQAVRWRFSCGLFRLPLVGAAGVTVGLKRSTFEVIERKNGQILVGR